MANPWIFACFPCPSVVDSRSSRWGRILILGCLSLLVLCRAWLWQSKRTEKDNQGQNPTMLEAPKKGAISVELRSTQTVCWHGVPQVKACQQMSVPPVLRMPPELRDANRQHFVA